MEIRLSERQTAIKHRELPIAAGFPIAFSLCRASIRHIAIVKSLVFADRLFGDTGGIVLSHHRYTSEIDHWLQLLCSQFYGMDASVVDVCMCSSIDPLVVDIQQLSHSIRTQAPLISQAHRILLAGQFISPAIHRVMPNLSSDIPPPLILSQHRCFFLLYLLISSPLRPIQTLALHLLMSRSLILKKPFHTWLTNQKNFMPSNNCLNPNSYTFTLQSQTALVIHSYSITDSIKATLEAKWGPWKGATGTTGDEVHLVLIGHHYHLHKSIKVSLVQTIWPYTIGPAPPMRVRATNLLDGTTAQK
ncbi:hypothetical protein IRJ41_005649 [Triplophysa rosa]|uniref:Uncharacterized protein n=1 Tax=Triplophysa rosa TaxID=992332 RepID=A0A9W7WUJ5_TRIRA|nr:hypothetical protein IRJ41_005649 [Triplophysa rosa]